MTVRTRSAARAVHKQLAMAWQALLCTTTLILTAPVMAMADSARFSIEAQPLPHALKMFAEQASMQLLYQYSVVAGMTANSLAGEMDKHEALEKLLRGTGLMVAYSTENAATIRPARTAPGTDAAPLPADATASEVAIGGGDPAKRSAGTVRLAQAEQATPQQGAEPPADQLEEIVVTARQREERLSDVPASVQAFTARDIKEAGIERPADFVALTPGVAQAQTAEIGELQLTIRGINTGRDVETNFAQVVDGVLLTNPYALNQELANIQQIEVLKGPQGATFGRNALAGAIIVTTKKPTDRFEADATVGYGNKNTQKANFYVAGGLSDTVKAGLSAFYRKTDGFFTNSFLNCDDCVDYYKEYGAAPRVILDFGAQGTLDIKAKYSKVTAGAINFNAAFALPGLAALTGNPDFFQNVNEHSFDYISNIAPQNEQVNKQVSIKGDWQVAADTLTAWVAYNDQTNVFLTDGASAAFGLYSRTPWCQADIANQVGGPLPSPTFYAGASSLLPPYGPSRCDGYQFQQRNQKDTSAEVRLTSPADQRLRWLGGLYYADIKREVVVAQGADEGLGFVRQAFVPATGPNPTDLLFADRFHSRVAAAFGQLAYDLVPGLEAAFGLRFDSERRSVDNEVPTGAAAFAQTPGFGTGATVPYINPAYTADPALATTGIPSRSQTFSQLQPKFSLNWKFVEHWSVYGSYGYGFRSGGFNSTGDNATIQQYLGNLKYVLPNGTVSTTPAVATAGIDYDDYKKEVSKAGEIGVKGDLLNHTLTLELAAYHTRVDNMQIFTFVAGPFGLLRVVSNIDAVTLQGLEGDVRWRANRYVSVFAGAGLIGSRIDRFASRPYTVGNKVPFAPAYTADAGVQFNVPLNPAGLELIARLDANSLGRTWFGPVQDNQVQTEFGLPGDYSKTSRDPYTLVNARLGLAADRWTVTAWSRNLANKQYIDEASAAPEFGGSFVHQAPGRAFGVDVSYQYGK